MKLTTLIVVLITFVLTLVGCNRGPQLTAQQLSHSIQVCEAAPRSELHMCTNKEYCDNEAPVISDCRKACTVLHRDGGSDPAKWGKDLYLTCNNACYTGDEEACTKKNGGLASR